MSCKSGLNTGTGCKSTFSCESAVRAPAAAVRLNRKNLVGHFIVRRSPRLQSHLTADQGRRRVRPALPRRGTCAVVPHAISQQQGTTSAR